MIKPNRFRPSLECLEDRNVPSGNSIVLQDGILNITVDPNRAHTAVVSEPSDGIIQVQLDNTQLTLAATVTEVNYHGGNRGDKFSNLTTFAGTLNFGDGNDVVFSKAANQVINAGEGNNFIQDQAGGSTITTGAGNDNIYGGAGDTIDAGAGRNIVYDLLGSNTITVTPDDSRDYIFTNAQSTVHGAQENDRVAVFFAAGRTPGSGTLVLDQGVLYFTANNDGNQFVLNPVGNKLVATYNLNDGTGVHTQVFARSQIKLIANFGGAGNDTFINNTFVPDVQYGAGGTNLLVGGFGPVNLEKAGGSAGNSIAVGRSPEFNDLNGSGSTNSTAVLIVNPFAKLNVIRSNNPADQVIGFVDDRDIFISPFQIKAGKGRRR